MRKFRKWFAQIMINKLLKNELDQLKIIISNEMGAVWKLSYSDVIKHLIKNFHESHRIEVPLERKLFVGSLFKNPGLKISSKLDRKQLISFSLED